MQSHKKLQNIVPQNIDKCRRLYVWFLQDWSLRGPLWCYIGIIRLTSNASKHLFISIVFIVDDNLTGLESYLKLFLLLIHLLHKETPDLFYQHLN